MGRRGGGQHPTGGKGSQVGGQEVVGDPSGHAPLHLTAHRPVGSPCRGQGSARRGPRAASRQYVKQKDISFYLPVAAPGHNPPTFNLYSTTHVSFPASDYFLSSNYRGDKME